MSEMNGKLSAYINDGETVSGYLDGVERLYPPVRFTYRRILAQNRAVIYRQIAQSNDPRKEETMAAQAIKAQVVSWDVLKPDSGEVPLETSEILRLQPRLINRLFRVLMGDEAPDEDPNVRDAERDHQAADDFAMALSGETPEEAAAKN